MCPQALQEAADLVGRLFSRHQPKRHVDLGIRDGDVHTVLAKVAITALKAHVG